MSYNQFFNTIMRYSFGNNWDDAKKEWIVNNIDRNEEGTNCICGHYPIKETIEIFNIRTMVKMIVGNCCIKKFDKYEGYEKVFQALRRGKVNRMIINFAYQHEIINAWEYNFLCDVWRKRVLSYKQSLVFSRLNKLILEYYSRKHN